MIVGRLQRSRISEQSSSIFGIPEGPGMGYGEDLKGSSTQAAQKDRENCQWESKE